MVRVIERSTYELFSLYACHASRRGLLLVRSSPKDLAHIASTE